MEKNTKLKILKEKRKVNNNNNNNNNNEIKVMVIKKKSKLLHFGKFALTKTLLYRKLVRQIF